MLYEIATGAPPFDLDDAWAVLVGHRDTPPEPPRSHRAELPEYFERIILDLLAKDPEERPHDAGELRRRIGAAAPHRRTCRPWRRRPARRRPGAAPAPRASRGCRPGPAA